MNTWRRAYIITAFFFMFMLQPVVAFAASSPDSKTTPRVVDNWNVIVTKAKEEGKLVISSSNTPPVRQAIAKGFKNTFGIEIEFIGGGRGSELATRLLNERQAGMYLQDVYIGGTGTILTVLKPAGAIDPLESIFMQSEVLNKKLWIGGDYPWADRDRKVIVLMLMPTAGQSCIINTTMVKPNEIRVYDDFLNPKWMGKIVLNDPTIGGPGLRFVAAGAEKIKSWDYMKELARQKPVIIRDQRLQVEWVAKGKYAIGLGMEPDLITEFLSAGAPIVEIMLKDDITASAGPNDLAMINRAAHPNAAKVFINWILGKEGQTILSKATGLVSIKTNVATDHITPARRLDRTKKYFIIDHEDFILNLKEYMTKAREIFGDLMK